MDATSKAKLRATGSVAARIAFLIVLGATLAGCDRCGNWWSPLQDQAQIEVCRQQPPRPQ